MFAGGSKNYSYATDEPARRTSKSVVILVQKIIVWTQPHRHTCKINEQDAQAQNRQRRCSAPVGGSAVGGSFSSWICVEQASVDHEKLERGVAERLLADRVKELAELQARYDAHKAETKARLATQIDALRQNIN